MRVTAVLTATGTRGTEFLAGPALITGMVVHCVLPRRLVIAQRRLG
jgi:hypothetical protein